MGGRVAGPLADASARGLTVQLPALPRGIAGWASTTTCGGRRSRRSHLKEEFGRPIPKPLETVEQALLELEISLDLSPRFFFSGRSCPAYFSPNSNHLIKT